jgi:hypothetical protein
MRHHSSFRRRKEENHRARDPYNVPTRQPAHRWEVDPAVARLDWTPPKDEPPGWGGRVYHTCTSVCRSSTSLGLSWRVASSWHGPVWPACRSSVSRASARRRSLPPTQARKHRGPGPGPDPLDRARGLRRGRARDQQTTVTPPLTPPAFHPRPQAPLPGRAPRAARVEASSAGDPWTATTCPRPRARSRCNSAPPS